MQDATLFVPLFATVAMRAVFSDTSRLQAMLDFEAALAGAQAACGAIPADAAPAIARACDASRFDLRALAQATALSGNAAIPLVRALRNAVAGQDERAARHVHQGATSQDCIDSGLVLQLQRAYALLDADIGRLGDTLQALAVAHASTVMAGRTLLQQAEPLSFGLKVAGWLDALGRNRVRLRTAAREVNVIQCGGATGTLAAFGARGLEIAAALAQTLGAQVPTLPWHSQRDRLVDFGGALAILLGGIGKMARDIALLAQTEIGEVAEPAAPGRGGSSALPHKQNPIGCAVALAAAAQAPGLQATLLGAMTQEHERGLGGWHAEWETLPRLCLLASGALAQMNEVLAGLRVDPVRMRANLWADGGLMFAPALAQALAVHWGSGPAHDRVAEWCRIAQREGRDLREIARRLDEVTSVLDAPTLAAVFDPDMQLGLGDALIARAVDAWCAARAT